MKHIPDGNIHQLSEDFGYILKITNYFSIKKFVKTKKEFCEKYAKYLIDTANPHEDYEELVKSLITMEKNDNFSFIYRPSMVPECMKPNHIIDLKQSSSLALKFKRNKYDKEWFKNHG